MKHKHADLIHAWADGAEIQFKRHNMKDWEDWGSNTCGPSWLNEWEYRLKPMPKPVIVRYEFRETNPRLDNAYDQPNLRLTFDGETGKLKKAEVI